MSKINPVKTAEFQMAQHRFTQFDCVVPAGTTDKDLENPDLWVNVAPKLRMWDEVRVIAEDHSFVAYLLVMFAQGTDARLKVVNGANLDDDDAESNSESKYEVKLRGPHKWCVINKENGDILNTGIAKKSEAQKWLEEYEAALRT